MTRSGSLTAASDFDSRPTKGRRRLEPGWWISIAVVAIRRLAKQKSAQNESVILSITLRTPGLDQAESVARSRSDQLCTLPVSVTSVPSHLDEDLAAVLRRTAPDRRVDVGLDDARHRLVLDADLIADAGHAHQARTASVAACFWYCQSTSPLSVIQPPSTSTLTALDSTEVVQSRTFLADWAMSLSVRREEPVQLDLHLDGQGLHPADALRSAFGVPLFRIGATSPASVTMPSLTSTPICVAWIAGSQSSWAITSFWSCASVFMSVFRSEDAMLRPCWKTVCAAPRRPPRPHRRPERGRPAGRSPWICLLPNRQRSRPRR
jgi:hypothetical protein